MWDLCADLQLRGWWCQGEGANTVSCSLARLEGKLRSKFCVLLPQEQDGGIEDLLFYLGLPQELENREASAKEVIPRVADCVGSSSFGQGGNCADSTAPNPVKELLLLPE